ncbi:preprotein translocase subunit SecE [Anaerococcus sp. mt242]|uniref:preprotein translocase subunit SecE n=1 Tax=unclassified Anaerococcus TaxID=2614126 RepID=UPI001932AF33|nr:preprotein translocase subunit SecE [Anaerococcus sp. mt242]MBM0046457.1 preprotein translocase subunit SecE [Anaerococcus sp. mt242]
MAKKEEGFFASVGRERKKIQWPSKENTIEYTLLVLAISIITGLVIWFLDKVVFSNLLNFLINL